MTLYQDTHHDPRTHREPPKGKPAAEPDTAYMACARKACMTRLDVTRVAPEKRAAFADAHGFVSENGADYCSKRCAAIHAIAPDGGSKIAEPAKAKTEALRVPTSIRLLADSDGEGGVIYWACCALWNCSHRFEAPSDRSRAARAAAVNGYVETSDGTFCSATCARKARTDIAAGIQAPTPLTAAVVEEAKAAIEEHPAKPSTEAQAPKADQPAPTGAQVIENRKARRERDRIAAALNK